MNSHYKLNGRFRMFFKYEHLVTLYDSDLKGGLDLSLVDMLEVRYQGWVGFFETRKNRFEST